MLANITLESVVFYLLFIDAIAANVIVWGGFQKDFKKRIGLFAEHLPLTKGWAIAYLIALIWMGSALVRLGVI